MTKKLNCIHMCERGGGGGGGGAGIIYLLPLPKAGGIILTSPKPLGTLRIHGLYLRFNGLPLFAE